MGAPKARMAKTLSNELTDMQAAFVAHYVICLDATKAAKKAGYSEKTAGNQGSALLGNPGVRAEIERRMKSRAKRLEITGENVLRELARIGFSDLRNVADWHPDTGVTVRPADDVDEDSAAAISEVSETRQVIRGRGGDESVNSKIKVKLHDKVKALDLIGRHIGLWNAMPDQGQQVTVTMSYNPSGKGAKDGKSPTKSDE